jgi:N-acyl-L-homoserine lactone synthetase
MQMNSVNAASIFAQNVIDLISRIEYRRAESDQDREAIFRLRYQCYLREGAIQPNETGRFEDSYDSAPNVSIFGLYLDGRLVSSIRVHVATAEHPVAPALTVFPDVLGPRIERGEVIVDPTRFVVDHDESRQHPGLAYATVRLGMLASEHADADYALATVRTEHRAFYRRLLCMEPVGEPRAYPNLKDPINLMGVSFPEMRQRVYDRYPFMMSTVAEQERLFGPKRERAKVGEARKGQAAAA